MSEQLSIWDLIQKKKEPLFEPKLMYIRSMDYKGVVYVEPIMFEGVRSIGKWRETHGDRYFLGLEYPYETK